MFLSLLFCLALCVAAPRPIPDLEHDEVLIKVSQHADHEHVLCVTAFSSPPAPVKRSSDTRFLPSRLTSEIL